MNGWMCGCCCGRRWRNEEEGERDCSVNAGEDVKCRTPSDANFFAKVRNVAENIFVYGDCWNDCGVADASICVFLGGCHGENVPTGRSLYPSILDKTVCHGMAGF